MLNLQLVNPSLLQHLSGSCTYRFRNEFGITISTIYGDFESLNHRISYFLDIPDFSPKSINCKIHFKIIY